MTRLLADYLHPVYSGSLRRDVHLRGTSIYALISFIHDELPRWRDRSDRKSEISETSLTSQLCSHLNSAARHSVGWDFLQFRVEEPDEQTRGRKIDLVAAPCDATVWVDGRRHVDFDSLLPIECKRLPTPLDRERDPREYVFSQNSSTGGIQRFKAGHHGAAHNIGAMIGYVQEHSCATWNLQISGWIRDLVSAGQSGWSASDYLQLTEDNQSRKIAVLRSSHVRKNGLADIELHHLWIQMN